MINLQLSQFMSLVGIKLTLKGLKGKEKVITFGTESYTSTSLTLLINPYNSDLWFNLAISKSGGIVLKQATNGNIGISIGDDITLFATQDKPGDNYLQIQTKKEVLYVPILRRNSNVKP